MTSGLVLSYNKCGRTWIRAFMIVYERLTGMSAKIYYKHKPFTKSPEKKRLLLVRDPCDTLVSLYFHYKYRSRINRKRAENMDIKSFIRSFHGAISISTSWREWLKVDVEQLEVKYEDLFNCIWEEILEWFKIEVDKNAMLKADETCKFDNIRNNLDMFKDQWGGHFLGKENGIWTAHPKNLESHKFRRGKVGGYVDYLSAGDIDYIRKQVPEAARWYNSYAG